MSKMLSIHIGYPSEKVPAISLLRFLLETAIVEHVHPKMGITTVNENKYEFGIVYPNKELMVGERTVMPGVTFLPDYLDASQDILKYIAKFKSATRCNSDFFGDVHLFYIQDNEEREGWFSRYGCENSLSIIEAYKVRTFRQSTFLMIVAPDPGFFLKEWWPDNLPRYSSPSTAEKNWDSLIQVVYSVIERFGEADLDETSLTIEGSGPIKESDWLIEHASRLPKLVVDYA